MDWGLKNSCSLNFYLSSVCSRFICFLQDSCYFYLIMFIFRKISETYEWGCSSIWYIQDAVLYGISETSLDWFKFILYSRCRRMDLTFGLSFSSFLWCWGIMDVWVMMLLPSALSFFECANLYDGYWVSYDLYEAFFYGCCVTYWVSLSYLFLWRMCLC